MHRREHERAWCLQGALQLRGEGRLAGAVYSFCVKVPPNAVGACGLGGGPGGGGTAINNSGQKGGGGAREGDLEGGVGGVSGRRVALPVGRGLHGAQGGALRAPGAAPRALGQVPGPRPHAARNHRRLHWDAVRDRQLRIRRTRHLLQPHAIPVHRQLIRGTDPASGA